MLRERGQNELINNAINIFLTSLAKDKAIAIILSGTGQDGLYETEEIISNKFLVIVQDTKTALFQFMPNSIIEYGHPDYVLFPEDIIQKICDFV